MQIVPKVVILIAFTGALSQPVASFANQESNREWGTLSIDLRNYAFERDFEGATTDREDIAVGGIVRYRSRDWSGISAGLSLYTSQCLEVDDDKNVYGLLGKDEQGDHESYSVLGEAFFKWHAEDTEFRIGRQQITTPWLNPHDVRMTPNSFEAVFLKNSSMKGLELSFAHVTKVKPKTETQFLAMSEYVAADGDEPLTLVGASWSGVPGLRLQGWDYLVHEVWNDIYLRADYSREAADMKWSAGVRYLQRRSAGDELAGDVDTEHTGITVAVERGGLILDAAMSRNGDNGFSRPWGHDTTISNQVHVADRAREQAWKVGAKYTFGPGALHGVVVAGLISELDTPDSGVDASQDRREWNLDLRYAFSGALNGLTLRARYADIDESATPAADDHTDVRFYLRYQNEF